MLTTLSVDVGLDGVGCGFFEGNDLVAGWFAARVEGLPRRGPLGWRAVVDGLQDTFGALSDRPPDRMAIELMKVYREGQRRADDLLQLQGIAGGIVDRLRPKEVEDVVAQEWKGQVPKDVMVERIRGWVQKRGWTDRVLLPKPALAHNVWDGVGIGLVALGLEGPPSKRRFR